MELKGQRRLAVDRDTAWRQLNDPEILRGCIAGCEAMERVAEGEFALTMVAVLGPVRARFHGRLHLEDVAAPERYTLRFEGEGGAAGLARGSARVTLAEDSGATLLEYAVNAQIAGRIAQVGSRLVDSVALKLAESFFAAFEKQLGSDAR